MHEIKIQNIFLFIGSMVAVSIFTSLLIIYRKFLVIARGLAFW